MIQWIALAVAADAQSKASAAKRTADEAVETIHNSTSSQMVIIHEFEFDLVPTKNRNFFEQLFGLSLKRVIQEKPFRKFSIKRGDILNMEECEDGNGTAYVCIRLSEYAKVPGTVENSTRIAVCIPGTLEEVAAVLG